MQKIFQVFLIVSLGITSIKASDCPPPKDAPFKKVMNVSFAEDYLECPTIIHAQLFSSDRPKSWAFPSNLNDFVIFQCIGVGEDPKAMPLSGELTGEFIAIPKNKSDLIFELNRGDKVKITGVTWIYKIDGSNFQTVYFMATSIEKETP
jgi:hypothetical protein